MIRIDFVPCPNKFAYGLRIGMEDANRVPTHAVKQLVMTPHDVTQPLPIALELDINEIREMVRDLSSPVYSPLKMTDADVKQNALLTLIKSHQPYSGQVTTHTQLMSKDGSHLSSEGPKEVWKVTVEKVGDL